MTSLPDAALSDPRRRRWLGGLAMAAAAAPLRAAPSPPFVPAVEVESGIYMVPGEHGEPEAANLGRVGNAGFIVGRSGVVAIDCGTSLAHGQALLRAIAEVTDRPVKLVVVTHARQEFLFGAAAYQARGIPVHMQRQVSQLMTSRCENCLKAMQREFGEDAMRGTVVPKADVLFDETHAMDVIGRPVFLQVYGHSSGPGDTAVFDLRSGTLFAGGLLDFERIPDVQDSDLPGWHDALAGLRTLRVNTVVPGHGSATSSEAIDAVERYLLRLEARIAALSRAGAALSEVPDAAALPDYARWDQYDTVHRRNAAIVFLRQERAQMFK